MTDAAQIVWQNRIDGRFRVKVERVDGDRGRFTVTDEVAVEDGGLGLLADEIVPLLFGAAYGPDGQDVQLWMDRGVEVVDAALAGGSD